MPPKKRTQTVGEDGRGKEGADEPVVNQLTDPVGLRGKMEARFLRSNTSTFWELLKLKPNPCWRGGRGEKEKYHKAIGNMLICALLVETEQQSSAFHRHWPPKIASERWVVLVANKRRGAKVHGCQQSEFTANSYYECTGSQSGCGILARPLWKYKGQLCKVRRCAYSSHEFESGAGLVDLFFLAKDL